MMEQSKKQENIKHLCDHVRTLVESEKNTQRLQYWSGVAGLPNTFIRNLPCLDLPVVPFIADLDREMWAQVLDFNVEEIYEDPLTSLAFELEKKIYAFEQFEDDNPITKNITIYHGVGIIQTFFGLEQEPAHESHEPWVGKESIIKEKDDLKSLSFPDFYNSGLAPKIHRMYAEIRECVDDDFTIIFPEWDFGPYGIAASLRGFEELAIDMIDDPGFVHHLMQFLYDSTIQWSQERIKFLGEDLIPLYMPNDDVNVPIISPKGYKEYVLPYEIKISEFHGGIDYWHSCGRVDPIVKYIKEIPNLKMIHISYASELKKSAEVIGKDHIIERVLNPIDDVLDASPEQMEATLHEIKSLCEGLHYTVRADAFQKHSTLENDLNQIKLWIQACRKILHAD